jgi:hypothetical protein
MTPLTSFIHSIIEITSDEVTIIEEAFDYQEISKGELYVKQGVIWNQIGFVLSGKLRNYYIDEKGNEITCFFVEAEHFISSFTSFLTNTPARENIADLENTIMRFISKKDLENLCAIVPKMQIVRRVIAENLFIIMEKRIAMLQSQSAHERYQKMLNENPDIILSVPLQYTASFLGITPQHLSRLRRELK